MAATFAEKALARAAGLDTARAGQILNITPHRVLSHDNTAAIRRIFAQISTRVRTPDRLAITLDHAVPPPSTLHARNHAEIRAFVQEQHIPHFFEAGRGICHQVLSEQALVLPGQVVLGADSHTTHLGWLGAFGAGVGRSEVAALWATDQLWLQIPATIRIELVGALPAGVTSKDLALWILQHLGQDGGTYHAIEFAGEGLSTLSLDSRMVLPNMMAEAGVKNAYLPPDETLFQWLAPRLGARTGQSQEESLHALREQALYPDPDAFYLAQYRIDLTTLEPLVALPHNPAHTAPLSRVTNVPVHQAFLGTCTNGRLEDLAAAVEVLRLPDGSVRKIAPGTRFLVIPASRQVLQAALKQGYIETLVAAGAMIGTPGCGPCMGNHFGIPASDENVISTANRNYQGRMGTPESNIYLASPAVVAASAVTGRITAPAELLASSPPVQPSASAWQELATASPLPQASLSPSPPAATFVQIQQGRVWKYGDHVNTDLIFPGKYTYTLREPAEWAAHALEDLDPNFAAAVQPGDIIVAGRNWGCGSSREQAVGCLQAVGVRIIIAESFARIYYRNAVNNGILPIVCPEAARTIQHGETIRVDVAQARIHCQAGSFTFTPLSPALQAILTAGGLIPLVKKAVKEM